MGQAEQTIGALFPEPRGPLQERLWHMAVRMTELKHLRDAFLVDRSDDAYRAIQNRHQAFMTDTELLCVEAQGAGMPAAVEDSLLAFFAFNRQTKEMLTREEDDPPPLEAA